MSASVIGGVGAVVVVGAVGAVRGNSALGLQR